MKRTKLLRDAGLLVFFLQAVGCVGIEEGDPAKPAVAERKSMQERLSENHGFKQDAEGNWVPRSDKRSMFESQRDSGISKEDFKKKEFKAGEYAKKNWWGRKSHETGSYEGDTDGSRFQTEARQDGKVFRDAGKLADRQEPYSTNQIDRKAAYEEGRDGVDKPGSAYVESQRKTYKAPSVIDWKEQREMSNRSKDILGR